MTRPDKKQLYNNKIAKMTVSGFVASGVSDVVTPELVTAATTDGVTVTPSNGSEASLGFIVTSTENKVDIVDNITKTRVGDVNGNEIFGRLTESGGVYTLSYLSIQSGTETAVSVSQTIDFLPSYNFALKDFPFDSSIRLDNAIFSVVAMAQQQLAISSDVTINKHYDIIEGDLTTAPANSTTVIRLGDLSTGSIIKNKTSVVARVDNIATKKLRLAGLNTNFAEDSIFTILSQTVSSPASGNILTASADVSGDVKIGDTIQVGINDIFTVANVATNIITTNEAIITSYSADALNIGGLFIDPEDSVQIYGRNNDTWRGV